MFGGIDYMGMIEGYEVREPTFHDLPDFFELMQDHPETKLPPRLLQACVYKDGVKLGPGVNSLPLRLILALTNECIRVAGIAGTESGNG